MPTFQVPLAFLDLNESTPPINTNLLFYNQLENQLSRGWYNEANQLILVGAQFKPTHYAVYEEELELQSGRLRNFGVKDEAGEFSEIQASSHLDAAARYRHTNNALTPATRLITIDTEVAVGRRRGQQTQQHD